MHLPSSIFRKMDTDLCSANSSLILFFGEFCTMNGFFFHDLESQAMAVEDSETIFICVI